MRRRISLYNIIEQLESNPGINPYQKPIESQIKQQLQEEKAYKAEKLYLLIIEIILLLIYPARILFYVLRWAIKTLKENPERMTNTQQ